MTLTTQFNLAAPKRGRALRQLFGVFVAVAAIYGTLSVEPMLRPGVAAALGTLALALAGPRIPHPVLIVRDFTILMLIGGLSRGGLEAWHQPARWVDAAHLSLAGGAVALCLYLGVALARTAGGTPLAHRESLFLLGVPLFVKALFLLTSPVLLDSLARSVTLGLVPDPVLLQWIGRAVTLFIVSEAIIIGVGLALDRRLSRQAGLQLLLAVSALLTASTPDIADLASSQNMNALGAPLKVLVVLGATIVAQAGLWSITYFLTGAIIDALRGQRPVFSSSFSQWKEGLFKGAIYGGVFMAILQIVAFWIENPYWREIQQVAPVVAFGLAGLLAFPLIKTVIESFDGSAPFFARLRLSYGEPWNFVRGAVLGCAFGSLATGLLDGRVARPLFGLALGAGAYAGVDLLRDLFEISQGRRLQLQSIRVYALGAILGGIVGAALGSYFDDAQIKVVVEKFVRYVAVYYPAAGLSTDHYVIFPLFSKWGATDLGVVTGGVRLFFSESLSGVINWSFAAPLFSVNLVVLTALVQRSSAPIKRLVTRAGVVDLVEQAFRVQRWGLWMAPVIYSFLRLAPEPTWYNQDGAIRSLVAIVMNGQLPAAGFHDWSLTLFLGLLAYDWLRVAIWFDHMGLRVATLVNASFVVGDVLDERAARWLGHGARTRIIPEGIRRFATWAPLLIPFYIPRGAEWDKVWSEAEHIRTSALPLLAPVKTLLLAYSTLAVGAAILTAAFFISKRRKGNGVGVSETETRISNGTLTLELSPNDGYHMRVASAFRFGATLDLTKRPASPGDGRGLFFLLREQDESLGVLASPATLISSSPTALHFHQASAALAIETDVTILRSDPAAHWRMRIRNEAQHARTIRLTSVRQIALSDWDSYERHPFYQGLFIATSFVPRLKALIAGNQKLKSGGRNETYYHAAHWSGDAIRLRGYQDSRACFLGKGTSAQPAGLSSLWAPSDAGTCFTFDPLACLDLEIEIEAGGSRELQFIDGYAVDAAEAAASIARILKKQPVGASELNATLGIIRPTLDRHDGDPENLIALSPDTVTLGWNSTRPISHVLANSYGHGAIVTNDGSIFSFARNSQQNGLTPFIGETTPAHRIGQALYVRDIEAGVTLSPAFLPLRKEEGGYRIEFARGIATYRCTLNQTELSYEIVVPLNAPIELRLVTIRNQSATAKRYRVVPYFEMVLGEVSGDGERAMIVHEDIASNALGFSNPKNNFESGTAFVATSWAEPERETWRRGFLGAGDFTNPSFVQGNASQPVRPKDRARIAAFAKTLDVPPGGEAKIAIALGQTNTADEARSMIAHWANPAQVERAREETRDGWRALCGVLRIETNNQQFDQLVNDWLPYQIMASRLWGRLGPNQRSGGFGFRDQLQDVLPLCILKPELARAQILLHARQQFLAGDVLQWWHLDQDGHTGLGARNRASDPHLWLPYLVSHYIEITGDSAILDEKIRYLEGMPIPPGLEGIAFAPRPSRDVASLDDHCQRAIARSLKARGANQLPLIGAGDWNDGLSHVGAKGRGESTWLGFFLFDVLNRYAALLELRGQRNISSQYRVHAQELRTALEKFWRNDRFVRAVNDSGEELLFADALTASWPVLSGATTYARSRTGLETAIEALEKDNLVLLLDPAFSARSKPPAGRISDYPPGVRENGGQYSHGVSWLVDAHCALADQAEREGDAALANTLRTKAASLWIKISPLGRQGSDGLALHQQPADIYFGAGYEGRGGWTWYTGAAARMLFAAYAVLGLSVRGGAASLAAHSGIAKGPLILKRVHFRGQELVP